MRRLATAVAALALLAAVAGGVAIPVVADGGNTTSTPANTTTPAGDVEYSLDDLKADGTHYNVDSFRAAKIDGEYRGYWIEYSPAGQPWRSVTPESPGAKLPASATLRTNTLYVVTWRVDPGTVTRNVTIVLWERGTRRIQHPNTTEAVPAAVNVSVVRTQITVTRGKSLSKIELPRVDDPRRVTMWLDAAPQEARWTIERYKTIATATPVNIDTWGDFWYYAAGILLLPTGIGGALAGRKVRAYVEAAGVGPQWGFGKWLAVITLVTVAGLWLAYEFVAELIVLAPWLVSGYLVAVFAAYMLATHRGDVQRVLFLRPYITAVEAFNTLPDEVQPEETDGGTAESKKPRGYGEDMPFATVEEHKVIRDARGLPSIIKPGLLAFLARAKGARSRLKNYDTAKARLPLPNSKWEEIIVVDPDADELVDYEPEGWQLDLPSPETWQDALVLVGVGAAYAGAVYAFAVAFGTVMYGVGAVVALVLAAYAFVRPQSSYSEFEPAAAHLRPVLATMLTGAIGNADAKTLEETRKDNVRLKARAEKDVDERVEERDATLVEEMLGVDPDATVAQNGGGDGEVTLGDLDVDDLEDVLAADGEFADPPDDGDTRQLDDLDEVVGGD